MKKKKLVYILLILSLVSCQRMDPSSSNNSILESSQNSTTNQDNIIIDIYALNDLHGRISEQSSESIPGISKISSYLKEKKSKNEDGTILIASGDIFQDTYESSTNKGNLISECLEEMEFDVFTLGNHDLDWGVDAYLENQKLSPSVTYLSSNVYNYPDETTLASIGKDYHIVEKNNLKIGIIGTIGSTQNTSITSSIWENLSFKETTNIVKNLSDQLRTQEGCDLIIWSNHADYDDSNASQVTMVSPVSNKRYVDAVLLGHSHQVEKYLTNQVPFVQSGSNGRSISHIQLEYNPNNQEVNTNIYGSEGYNQIQYQDEDPAINQIISKYQTPEYFQVKNQVVGNLTSSSSYQINSRYMGSLLAKATYDMYEEEMKEVDIVINNGVRDTGSLGEQTREDIFNMLPFTNYTYICQDIKGEDILNELGYSSTYYYQVDENLVFNKNETYTIACIDYMLLHKNSQREYNYFPSFKMENVTYKIEKYCYEIVIDYLSEQGTIDESFLTGGNYK